MEQTINPLKKTKVFVEVSPLLVTDLSGIGHTLLSILHQWAQMGELHERYEIMLLVPFNVRHKLDAYGLPFPVKPIPIPGKLFRVLRRLNLLPPLDLWCGEGVYVFPNYWNSPLLYSSSLTYIYDLSFLTFPESVEPKNRQFLQANVSKWMSRTDKIVTLSNFVENEIIDKYNVPKPKIVVIPNGVDRGLFKVYASEVIANTKAKYGIEGKYLLYVGNIEPRKNLPKLVKAYELLPPKLQKDYGLVIVGSGGWNNSEILKGIKEAQQRGLNVARVVDHVPDDSLAVLYAGATALVHPALYEGFGMTPLEAMAAGTPVIVSATSSLKEVVGDAGLFVDPASERDISDKIKLLLENPKLQQELRDRGDLRASEFSWANTASLLSKCMKEANLHNHE